MKIYVITKGEYSDYHICAVATDLEKANALAEYYSDRYDAAEVEEYDTDDAPDPTKGKWMYRVRFAPSGDVADINQVLPDYCDKKTWEYTNEPGYVYACVQADNEEAAIKIGAERRAKYLAEKMGL